MEVEGPLAGVARGLERIEPEDPVVTGAEALEDVAGEPAAADLREAGARRPLGPPQRVNLSISSPLRVAWLVDEMPHHHLCEASDTEGWFLSEMQT